MDASAQEVSPRPSERLRLTVAYDGRSFAGWQSQANGDAVQDHLERAFARLCGGGRIVVHGSGRTDAGVHALGQVAHADVPERSRHSPEGWTAALNAGLPPQIRVLAVRHAAAGFHARFAATGKIYRYRIWNSPVLSPFEVGRAWHFPNALDRAMLAAVAQRLVGEHDFAAFSANRGKPNENTVRTIRRVEVKCHRRLIVLEYEGSGFLYKMVRLMTGSLVRCAQGRKPAEWISQLLAAEVEKTSFAAPADGLYLRRVLYGKKPDVL